MKEVPFANALTLVVSIVYIVCAVAVAVARDAFISIAALTLHGIDLKALPVKDVDLGSAILGLVVTAVFAWVSGYIFASSYNKLAK